MSLPLLKTFFLPVCGIIFYLRLKLHSHTPTILAYAHLSGPSDYNNMPLDPMLGEVQVHKKTEKRGTWVFHCVDGWYLNILPEHYKVHNRHIESTLTEQLSDTFWFRHWDITNLAHAPPTNSWKLLLIAKQLSPPFQLLPRIPTFGISKR